MFALMHACAMGYLIIAMPQSSSTSLEVDVGRASHRPHTQEFPCNRKTLAIWNGTFAGMHMHSDTCTLSSSVLTRWIFSQTHIFKQHVVPDPNNSKVVQDALRRRARIVYLTRNPRQSGHAACERSVAEHRTPDIRAIEKKIEAMRQWQAQWDVVFRTAAVLHVTYDDLRRHNSQMVQSILDFWGLQAHPFNHSKMRFVNSTSKACSRFRDGDAAVPSAGSPKALIVHSLASARNRTRHLAL